RRRGRTDQQPDRTLTATYENENEDLRMLAEPADRATLGHHPHLYRDRPRLGPQRRRRPPRCPPRTTHPQPLNGYLRSCCSEVLGRFRGVIGVRGGGWRVLVGHQGWSLICSPQRAGPMAARLSVSWVGGPVRI